MKEVRRLLEVLTPLIRDPKHRFDSRSFGTLVYPLKNMDSSTIEVRKFIQAISYRLEGHDDPLDGQSIGNMLFGLQKMNSHVSSTINDCFRYIIVFLLSHSHIAIYVVFCSILRCLNWLVLLRLKYPKWNRL